MAFSRLSLAALTCLALLAATAAHRAPTAALSARVAAAHGGLSLAERLDGAAGSQQCWEALVEIKSCTGEIILFFLNGEAYLGPGCCSAIRVIEGSCWAADAMLSFIGFTPEEGDMLKGYCDAGDDNGAAGGQSGAARESVAAAVAGRKSKGRR
ncbi:hypothetical protein BS78_01G386400 [Paspalum vaginatum]|nr:hypothetical protein BS78_01G386400 [Paspalum vaginatum]